MGHGRTLAALAADGTADDAPARPGIIEAMTERTAPDAGTLACPFVAFEDDRDERSERPDHRHRCYAEVRPAPRAIAHQEAFCLSGELRGLPHVPGLGAAGVGPGA